MSIQNLKSINKHTIKVKELETSNLKIKNNILDVANGTITCDIVVETYAGQFEIDPGQTIDIKINRIGDQCNLQFVNLNVTVSSAGTASLDIVLPTGTLDLYGLRTSLNVQDTTFLRIDSSYPQITTRISLDNNLEILHLYSIESSGSYTATSVISIPADQMSYIRI